MNNPFSGKPFDLKLLGGAFRVTEKRPSAMTPAIVMSAIGLPWLAGLCWLFRDHAALLYVVAALLVLDVAGPWVAYFFFAVRDPKYLLSEPTHVELARLLNQKDIPIDVSLASVMVKPVENPALKEPARQLGGGDPK